MAELIVALDLGSVDDALRVVDQLPGLTWAKIGPMLFVEDGPRIIGVLKRRGLKVFLDLKWHDIPNSVAGAVRAASGQGVDLATVHALGGSEMLTAARDASGDMRLAAVSVLTSHAPESYWRTVGNPGDRELGSEVVRLARLAVDAGIQGLVCAASEVADVKTTAGPDCWIIVPGIRPGAAPADDQRRTADPLTAVKAGATHLVIGRPITRAKCPLEVYNSIRKDLG